VLRRAAHRESANRSPWRHAARASASLRTAPNCTTQPPFFDSVGGTEAAGGETGTGAGLAAEGTAAGLAAAAVLAGGGEGCSGDGNKRSIFWSSFLAPIRS